MGFVVCFIVILLWTTVFPSFLQLLLRMDQPNPFSTKRSQCLGQLDVFIANVPWVFLEYFMKPTTGRTAGPDVVTISKDAVVRPVCAAAMNAVRPSSAGGG